MVTTGVKKTGFCSTAPYFPGFPYWCTAVGKLLDLLSGTSKDISEPLQRLKGICSKNKGRRIFLFSGCIFLKDSCHDCPFHFISFCSWGFHVEFRSFEYSFLCFVLFIYAWHTKKIKNCHLFSTTPPV